MGNYTGKSGSRIRDVNLDNENSRSGPQSSGNINLSIGVDTEEMLREKLGYAQFE